MSRKRAIYYVNEADCLIPGSGAYTHIQVGLKELAKAFDVQLFASSDPQLGRNTSNSKIIKAKSIPFKKFLKGVYLLFKHNSNIYRDFNKIRRQKPDFIFERAGYLSYKGLLIARFLRIPHFYEVNGVLWIDNREYFSRLWNAIARRIESFFFLKSNFVFFVGGVGEYYQVPSSRMISIQNGIDSDFLEPFYNHSKSFTDGQIHIVFIGHAMPHHRLDIFTEASKKISDPGRFHIHLVGSNLSGYVKDFRPGMKVSLHGVLTHEQLKELLYKCHVGVIPYLRDYFSNVKAFMYAASKVLIIMPLIGNFKNVFNQHQISVIKNESVDDFARALDAVTEELVAEKGGLAFDLVKEKFTWDKIFAQVISEINLRIDARTSYT